MHPGAVIPTLLPLFIAVAIRRAEQCIHRQLTDARAFTAESAVPLSPSRSIERRRLQSLIRGGAVRLTANSHHFLDADGWERHLSNRRRRVLFALSVIAALLGIAVAVFFFMR
jgi:hypothetical protein